MTPHQLHPFDGRMRNVRSHNSGIREIRLLSPHLPAPPKQLNQLLTGSRRSYLACRAVNNISSACFRTIQGARRRLSADPWRALRAPRPDLALPFPPHPGAPLVLARGFLQPAATQPWTRRASPLPWQVLRRRKPCWRHPARPVDDGRFWHIVRCRASTLAARRERWAAPLHRGRARALGS